MNLTYARHLVLLACIVVVVTSGLSTRQETYLHCPVTGDRLDRDKDSMA
jgi:hypothetical protein